jgi:hypothetical protein
MLGLLWAFAAQAAEFPWQTPRPGRILLEDDFSSENFGNGALNYSRFANWDIISGTVDLLGNGLWRDFPGHGLYLDLDGSTNNAGTLRSKEAFRLRRGTYRLQFDLSGNPAGGRNSMTVRLGDVFRETFEMAPYESFTTITRDISVSTPAQARLIFRHAGGDNTGLLFDNVKLIRLGREGPPPATGVDQEEQQLLDALKRYFETH